LLNLDVGNRAVKLVGGSIDLRKIVVADIIQLIFSFPNKKIVEYYTNSDIAKICFEQLLAGKLHPNGPKKREPILQDPNCVFIWHTGFLQLHVEHFVVWVHGSTQWLLVGRYHKVLGTVGAVPDYILHLLEVGP
jgi:hypothetical protein